VGYYAPGPNDTLRPFLYHNGSYVELPTPENKSGYARAINNSGEVVGYSGGDVNNSGMFLYRNGVSYDMSDLVVGRLSGWSSFMIQGINDSGWIVGNAVYGPDKTYGQPFLLKPID
jgi:probable HAF family extracellular repeat protein